VGRLRGKAGAAQIEAAGDIALVAGAESSLRARVTGLEIDDALRAAVPEEPRGLLADLAAEGVIDLEVLLHGRAGGEGPTRLRPEVVATWRDGAMRPEAFPYPVTAVAGLLHYHDERLEIERVAGRLGAGTVGISGRAYLDRMPVAGGGDGAPPDRADDAGPPITLRIQARDVAIDRSLRAAMPEGVRSGFEGLGPEGAFDLDARASFYPEAVREGLLVWNAELGLRVARLDAGLELNDIDAVARLHGHALVGGPDPPAPEIRGALAVRSLRYKEQVLEHARARVRLGPELFEISDLKGGFLGGLLRGDIYVFLGRPNLFGAVLELSDGRVERWVGGPADKQGRRLSGRINGRLRFAGRRGLELEGDPGTFMGEGKVQIGGARLWKVPVFSDDLYFDRAEVVLRLAEQGRMTVDYAELSSAAISFSGKGLIVDGNARVRLIHELGRVIVDDIPVIGWIWRFVKGSLIAIELSGPLDDARVVAVPLPAVVDPFRDLFGE
jgi:hypothetical protein